MQALISNINQVTPTWLTDVLREGGYLPEGYVKEVQLQPNLKAKSQIIPLHLQYSVDAPNSAPSRLILKISKPLLEESPKEFAFYSFVSTNMTDLPIIRCYEAVYSPSMRQGHLLLQDLSDTHFSHPPSQLPPLNVYSEQIVDALASLHAASWDDINLEEQIIQSRSNIKDTHAIAAELVTWAENTFPKFADFLGDRLSQERCQIYERAMVSLLPSLSARFASNKALTLIHGDIHIGNFLYPYDPKHEMVRILDWKSWRRDIGADDLAHMMAVFWFPERRSRLEQKLLRRYHNRLLEYGVMGYDWQACWYDYRLSVVRHLFYPIWQWTMDAPADIWWNHLERVILAFQDLQCAELLEE
jgi:thiamine kinase-like enzyme